MIKRIFSYFSKFEIALWLSSVTLIIASFFIFGAEGYLSLAASIVGITALLFFAKGNPIGQILVIVFAILYGIISYGFSYYGEMITYLGMSTPMAVMAFISWVKNPYEKGKAEVKIENLTPKDVVVISLVTLTVTVAFYFILGWLGTANLMASTISVATSFFAVSLSYKRSPYYAIAYAANDIVLMVLWTMAAFSDISYISVVVCFAVFLVNDIYTFISWLKMRKRQSGNA